MADSEASGDARLHDPVDDPVDTDQLAVDPPENGDVLADDAEFQRVEPGVAVAEWVEPPPPTAAEERTFDAFNASTWNFKPAPTPWYRTGPSVAALVAVSIAVIALVVSGVLLAFRGTSGEANVPANAPGSSTAATTATVEATPTTESPLPPPPPPPAPPPPPTASEINQAPVYQRPQQQQPTKKPEINVTRSPMSVRPQMPGTKRP